MAVEKTFQTRKIVDTTDGKKKKKRRKKHHMTEENMLTNATMTLVKSVDRSKSITRRPDGSPGAAPALGQKLVNLATKIANDAAVCLKASNIPEKTISSRHIEVGMRMAIGGNERMNKDSQQYKTMMSCVNAGRKASAAYKDSEKGTMAERAGDDFSVTADTGTKTTWPLTRFARIIRDATPDHTRVSRAAVVFLGAGVMEAGKEIVRSAIEVKESIPGARRRSTRLQTSEIAAGVTMAGLGGDGCRSDFASRGVRADLDGNLRVDTDDARQAFAAYLERDGCFVPDPSDIVKAQEPYSKKGIDARARLDNCMPMLRRKYPGIVEAEEKAKAREQAAAARANRG